ncbi:MAG: polymerase subunit sigma-24 [Devosia sp.]|uniref:RNA polymerase sigma factor n=1 Tax=Devosia sp. TaxID=1871048 RepID=UPI00261D4C44|nr:RNA polymerase sigma factor [Devosia sp.]MDB5539319.1 polymerase subunit sigma-24 [Devosia sp.]
MTSIDAVWRAESRRVLATLIRLLRDFDRAEEALNDAFLAAAEQWPRDGVPANPRAWLVSAGRFKAIDRLRRKARFDRVAAELALADEETEMAPEPEHIADDRLRLIFVCCHPELPPDAQIALTLRETCGLLTEEIAAAFLAKPSAIAQRIVRAKSRIRDLGLPYDVPEPEELAVRLDAVLRTIYLIFNEGYAASHGTELVRVDLCDEAIRLCRLLIALLPESDSEAEGLLALMLLQHARGAARTDRAGDLVLIADQDRRLWNRSEIAEGVALVEGAMARPVLTAYVIEAAIAAEHAIAPTAEATDWREIVQLYDLLRRADPSPVVALNRAVAVAMRDGPEAGLREINAILEGGRLDDFRYLHAARADLLRRLGRRDEARAAYAAALELTHQAAEQRFIEGRLNELQD